MSQNLDRLKKSMKKLEKPRPLKRSITENRQNTSDFCVPSSEIDKVLTLLDTVSMQLMNTSFGMVLEHNIFKLCFNLKAYGQHLEELYGDRLDRAFHTFRNAYKDDRLDESSRVCLLEIIDLRAKNWAVDDNILNFYKSKFNSLENKALTPVDPAGLVTSLPYTAPSTPVIAFGDVTETSGMNSNVLHSFSTQNTSLGEYQYTVMIGNEPVKISGASLDHVRIAKFLLDEVFNRASVQYVGSGDVFTMLQEEQRLSPMERVNFVLGGRMGSSGNTERDERLEAANAPIAEEREYRTADSPFMREENAECKTSSRESEDETNVKPIAYSRQALLQMSLSSFSSEAPPNWDVISRKYPTIVRS